MLMYACTVGVFWMVFAKYSIMSNRTSLKQQLYYRSRRYIAHPTVTCEDYNLIADTSTLTFPYFLSLYFSTIHVLYVLYYYLLISLNTFLLLFISLSQNPTLQSKKQRRNRFHALQLWKSHALLSLSMSKSSEIINRKHTQTRPLSQ